MKTVNSVSIDITYKCNYRCKHCFNSSGCHDDSLELSDSQFLQIANDIAKQKPDSLCFCGGEPLLRKELIYSIANCLKEHSDRTILSVVSNGAFLDDSVAKKLKEVGIRRIQISLDGATQESHDWLRQNGAFKSAIKALNTLATHKIESAVAFSPNTHNLRELPVVIDMAVSLGCKELRIQPMMLLGRALEHIKEFSLSYRDYMYVNKIINAKNEEYIEHDFSCIWGDPLSHLKAAADNTFYHIIISATGKILASPYIPISFGDLRKAQIEQYINAGLFNVLKENELAKFMISQINSTEDMALLNYGFSGENNQIQIDLDLLSPTYKNETVEFLDKISH